MKIVRDLRAKLDEKNHGVWFTCKLKLKKDSLKRFTKTGHRMKVRGYLLEPAKVLKGFKNFDGLLERLTIRLQAVWLVWINKIHSNLLLFEYSGNKKSCK